MSSPSTLDAGSISEELAATKAMPSQLLLPQPTRRYVYVPVSQPLFHSLSAYRLASPRAAVQSQDPPPSKRARLSDSNTSATPPVVAGIPRSREGDDGAGAVSSAVSAASHHDTLGTATRMAHPAQALADAPASGIQQQGRHSQQAIDGSRPSDRPFEEDSTTPKHVDGADTDVARLGHARGGLPVVNGGTLHSRGSGLDRPVSDDPSLATSAIQSSGSLQNTSDKHRHLLHQPPRKKHLSMWTVDTDDVSSTSSAPPAVEETAHSLQADVLAQRGSQLSNEVARDDPAHDRSWRDSLSSTSNAADSMQSLGRFRRDASGDDHGIASANASPNPPPGASDAPTTDTADASAGVEARKKKKGKPRRDHRYLSKQALRPAIEAAAIIRDHPRPYVFLGDESRRIVDDNFETITLEYPGDNAREGFPIVVPSRSSEAEYNPINDIYVTTQMISQHCLSPEQASQVGDSRSGIIRGIMKACHRRDPIALQSAIADFNQVISRLRDDGAFEQDEIRGPPAPYELVTHILEQAYARSVAPSSHRLNNYEGFSDNVYGEIKHSFVHDLIKQAGIQPHHIFLDMGSGIGNVVLQVAAECLCESYGMEIMEIPSQLSKKQRSEFLSRMRYYAKPCGRIIVKQGDFLEDPDIHEVIAKADVIFVNNYAFGAELNQGILALFLDLKESAKVISLRSFVPVDRRPSLRRSNAIDPGSSVSWMVEGGKYYIHTVDRSKLK
ncbi:histone methylation protein DOT1-domain-containing protein [Entophlyctis helioformis]|nr:histone methylation protein DOT1-domain-containing protein [Entophlyctis helioformis]